MKIILLCIVFFSFSCQKEAESTTGLVNIKIEGFPEFVQPSDNPMTQQGISLGRSLFYDPILSSDSTVSCGSCHQMSSSFADLNKVFSTGVNQQVGHRNASALINLAWNKNLFWDGRSKTLEEQALEPISNPVEMNSSLDDVLKKLNQHPIYPSLFAQVFQQEKEVTKEMLAKVLAQFERTLISSESKFDLYQKGKLSFTKTEKFGMEIFFSEKAECFHCHGAPLFSDYLPHNNGLDENPIDKGLSGITGNPKDLGKFVSPTLRNIAFTAPYMHDGRFKTLEEVVDFYSDGVKYSSTIDPLIINPKGGGIHLTTKEKQALVAFLNTLSDQNFIKKPEFSEPKFFVIPVK